MYPPRMKEPAGTQSAGGLCHATNQIAGGIQPRRQSLPTCTKSPKKSSLLVQSPATPQTKKRLPPRPRGPLYRRRLHIRELLNKSVPLLLRLAMTGNGSFPKIIGNALDIQDFDIVFVEPQCGIGGESQAVSSVPDDKLDQ